MSRVLGWTLAVTLSAALVVSIPRVAQAICPAPVGELTYEEMIDQRTTGVDAFPIMILGVVVTTKDLGGRPGGSTVAKLAVAEHPVGFAPLVSRVRFWRIPGGGYPPYFEFKRGRRYVVIARSRPDRTFGFDGPCGQTGELSPPAFRALVRLART